MHTPNSSDQRPTEGDTDGGRDTERSAFFYEIGLAFAKVFNTADRAVHLAEPGKPVNMSATMTGRGDLKA